MYVNLCKMVRMNMNDTNKNITIINYKTYL